MKLLLQVLLLLLVLKAYPIISDAQVHGLQPARTICILTQHIRPYSTQQVAGAACPHIPTCLVANCWHSTDEH